MAYDENVWADSLRYHEQSIEDTLLLFKWLRRKTYTLIKTLPEEAWAHTAYHPENGDMTLDDWLDVYVAHVPETHKVHARKSRGMAEGEGMTGRHLQKSPLPLGSQG